MNRLVIFLFIVPQLLFAQPYKSLFTPGKQTRWNIFPNIAPSGTDSFTTYGDTILNGKTWKKFGNSHSFIYGFLREDTINGKIWYKGINPSQYLINDTDEKLVSDFKLTSIDSFYYNYHCGAFPNLDVVCWLKVDSVFYKDGLKHIRFDTTGLIGLFQMKLVIIEGVGTNFGFSYMFSSSIHSTVQCQYRDSVLFYLNQFVPVPNNCNVSFSFGINDIFNSKNETLRIYPNPATHQFSLNSNDVKKIEIFNSLGQLVLATMQTENINIEKLPSGIYWLWFWDEKKVVGSAKLMKQ